MEPIKWWNIELGVEEQEAEKRKGLLSHSPPSIIAEILFST